LAFSRILNDQEVVAEDKFTSSMEALPDIITLILAPRQPKPVWRQPSSSWLLAAYKGGEMALAITWQGYVDTDVNFSEFFGSDHTVAVRFMLQYPSAYTGPMVSINGSRQYLIGQGDFLEVPTRQSKLVLKVGSAQVVAPVTLIAGTWHHLAIVRRGDDFTSYLDGGAIGSTQLPAGDAVPAGTLRLGKDTFDANLDAGGRQFYGLLDDVTIFRTALDPSQLSQLASVLSCQGMSQVSTRLWPLATIRLVDGRPRCAAL
jgi:hypothetical protein